MLYMKNYKTILLDENSYNEIKAAKEYLSRQMEKTISFSYVVDRLIGRKMMLLQLQDEILQYITAFVSVMQKYNDVLGILLFGSVAKRTYGKFSDIDMLVVVQNSPGKYFDLAHEAISGLSSFREKLSKISLFLYLSPTVISAYCLFYHGSHNVFYFGFQTVAPIENVPRDRPFHIPTSI